MDDLGTLTGQPRPLAVGGKTYQIFPLTLGDFGRLQRWIDAQWANPLELARQQLGQGLSMAAEKHLLAIALEMAAKPRPRIGTPEADAVLMSVDGTVQMLLASIRKGDPSFTEEQARELLDQLSPGQLVQVMRDTTVDQVVHPTTPGTTGTTTS